MSNLEAIYIGGAWSKVQLLHVSSAQIEATRFTRVAFFLNVGHYHFVGAYAGATACLRGHSGSLHGHKLREVCLRGLRECGFVLKMPTRLQSGQLL